jgi:hypothetical protein
METKKIILIIVMVGFFAGTAYMIYTNFIAKGAPPKTIIDQSAVVVANPGVQVLPYGTKLDFSLLKQYNPDGRVFRYPEVDSTQIGVGVSDLIKPTLSPPK